MSKSFHNGDKLFQNSKVISYKPTMYVTRWVWHYENTSELEYKAHAGSSYLPKFCFTSVKSRVNSRPVYYSKKCSTDWEKLLKFEAEGQEYFLRSLEQFIRYEKPSQEQVF